MTVSSFTISEGDDEIYKNLGEGGKGVWSGFLKNQRKKPVTVLAKDIVSETTFQHWYEWLCLRTLIFDIFMIWICYKSV